MPDIGTNSDCNFCGEKFFVETRYSEEYGVCGDCANGIANYYSMSHGGRWLTWPNEKDERVSSKPVSQALRWSVFRDDGFACRMCGETEKPLHLDHIIPKARGGEGHRKNLQTLCETCNTSKGAR